MRELIKNEFVYLFHREFRKKAPFVGYFEGRTPKLLIISPEIAKQVMIKNFSNFHDNEFSNMVNEILFQAVFQILLSFIHSFAD
jgi:hypothetical protein